MLQRTAAHTARPASIAQNTRRNGSTFPTALSFNTGRKLGGKPRQK